MADFLTREERSERMSRIRSRDTGPEVMVRKALWKLGFRYRLHQRGLPGRPDLVFAGRRTVIFVHGCFWHAHHCQGGRVPGRNVAFWKAKFEANQARDKRNVARLRRLGWRVLTVWECQLGTIGRRERAIERLRKALMAQAPGIARRGV